MLQPEESNPRIWPDVVLGENARVAQVHSRAVGHSTVIDDRPYQVNFNGRQSYTHLLRVAEVTELVSLVRYASE